LKVEVSVSTEDLKLRNAWQDIAKRARHEPNPQKLTRLAQRLIDILDNHAHQCRAEQKTNRNKEQGCRRAA
jgi:glutamine synthetase adenylyltransferase